MACDTSKYIPKRKGEIKKVFVTRDNFSGVYESHKNSVYSIAYSYMKNPEDAMDQTQEAFIKLLSCQTEFNDEAHLKAWLIRVVINQCKNVLKNNKFIADEEISEDVAVYHDSHQGELVEYVSKLPEKYRLPIHLYYYEEYTVPMISAALEIPEGTVKIRLKRGREKLSRVLVKEEWL